jgi:NAD(P)-dependent dehydrogenase (short-subunit alcohol dehydrogenase family)
LVDTGGRTEQLGRTCEGMSADNDGATLSLAGYGLQDRVVIVTGGAQGIGSAFSHGFAVAGARVIVADLQIDKASAIAKELRDTGYRADAAKVDVTDPSSVEMMVDTIANGYGRIDVLVNNAALFSSIEVKPFEKISVSEWNAMMAVNVTGVFLGCRAVSPSMRAAGSGRIINISSVAQRMGRPNYLHYIASKGAVEAMTRSLARELGPDGITVNAILPGAIETEVPRGTVTSEQKQRILASQCVPRGGIATDIVSTALHLASPASGFVTGQSFIVDGGVVHG